jgi:hypothetical protein
MWLSMRSISSHVPQAKEQILLYKFPAQASLMVDPASPRAPNLVLDKQYNQDSQEEEEKNRQSRSGGRTRRVGGASRYAVE